MKKAVIAVKKAFEGHTLGRLTMPSKVYLNVSADGDFRAMPALASDSRMASLKWVNVHPNNRKKGMPSVMALLILNDAVTGRPLSIMDAAALTALRTGAAGGVAAKFLSRKNSRIAAFVGCGVQAVHQLEAISSVRRIEEVRFFDPSPEAQKKFLNAIGSFYQGKVIKADSVNKCTLGADIITTTTPSRKPVLFKKDVSPGAHINAIGADAAGKQEAEAALLKHASVFVDDREQAAHSGEINVPVSEKVLSLTNISGSLGEVIAGKIPGRQGDHEITLFDSTGLAIQDLACAVRIYKEALKEGGYESFSFFPPFY